MDNQISNSPQNTDPGGTKEQVSKEEAAKYSVPTKIDKVSLFSRLFGKHFKKQKEASTQPATQPQPAPVTQVTPTPQPANLTNQRN